MSNPASFARSHRLVAVVAACALLTACPFDKPEDHLARGKELAAKQQHSAAVVEFKNYLQSVPRSAEVRYLLGRELLLQNNPRAAEIELQKAYDGRYDRDLVVPLLVDSQVRQGDPDKISPQIAKTELKTPQANAKLQALLGTAALQKGNLDGAMKAFRAAQQFEPGFAAGRLGEARVDATRGDVAAATALVTKVLEKEPTNVDALVLKGDIALRNSARQEAIDAYLGAIALDPRNVPARSSLAGVYMATGSTDLAQPQVDELKKLAPRNPGVLYLDALISFTKKDYLHANDAITALFNESYNNGAAQILAGAISLAMKQPAQAEVHLIEGIKLTPNSIYARRILTGIYLRQNQPQKASEILQPALAAFPEDGTLLGLAGEVALQQGDYANASKLLDRSSKIDPSNTDVKIRGAAADLARGDEAGGFAALEAAVKTSGNDARPDIALVLARLNRQQYDEALAAWANLEKAQPNNPVTYNLRAAIDLGRKDRAAARVALEHAVSLQANFFPAVRNLAVLDEADGQFDAARQRYRKLLDKDKTNMSALIALAEFEMRHGGKPDDIVALLQDARRSNPAAEQPVATLASYYVSQGNLKQALAIAQEARDRDPKNLAYLAMIGELQLRTGGIDQAIVAFRELATARPGMIGYQIRLGQAMVLANQADLAVGVFEKALKDHPDAYEAQSAAVSALIAGKKPVEASRLLATIQKASPKSPVLTELDGDVKLAGKQYPEALALYRKAMAQSPGPRVLMKEYLAVQGSGKTAEANALLAEWLKNHPTDTEVRFFEGDEAMQAKDYAQAATSYRRALEANPVNAAALNNLAWALWQQKDPQAIGFAEKAHAIAPDSALVNDTLGWIATEQGDTRKGLELLRKAFLAAPTQPAIALHFAKAQIKDGQKDAARTTLQALVKASPSSPEAKESRELMATL